MLCSRDDNYRPAPRSWVSAALTAAMLTCFAVGGWLLAPSGWGTHHGDAVASVLPTQPAPHYITQNIEDVRLGQRVVGTNPLDHEMQPASNIRPDQWRAVRLTMQAYGVDYDLAFLRPLAWISDQQATVGGTIALSMPEMGLDGPATVVAISIHVRRSSRMTAGIAPSSPARCGTSPPTFSTSTSRDQPSRWASPTRIHSGPKTASNSSSPAN